MSINIDLDHLAQVGLDLHDGNGWTMFWNVQMDDDWREQYELDGDISVWDARDSLAPVKGFEMFADSAAECTNVPHLIEEYGATKDDLIIMQIDGDEAVFVRSELIA
jgi:hypothetical protein